MVTGKLTVSSVNPEAPTDVLIFIVDNEFVQLMMQK